MVSINSKLPDVGTTIFTVMSALASEHMAINLGQGFPDFPMNPELVELVNQAMKDGYNQYVHMAGYMPLREAIADKISFLYQTSIDPESKVTITPGGTYAIYTALTTVLRPGDEVIVFEPSYDSYIPNILVNGAIPIRIPLKFPGYTINWEEVKKAISPNTRMIMLNSPHNPTGTVLRENDLQELRGLVQNSRILILSDEVYEHLVYDNIEHLSILRYPDLLTRSFVCFSFGKVYNCTGWKLGYCVAPSALMAEFRKVHQYNCFSCFSPTQIALSEFLRRKDSYLGLKTDLQDRRDYFSALMENTRFTPLECHGSFFKCYRYNRISDERDSDFVQRITREFGVAAIPVSAFYQSGHDDHVIRFCFAKKKETLQLAVEKLMKV